MEDLETEIAQMYLDFIKVHKGLETQISEFAGINRDRFVLENFMRIQSRTKLKIDYFILTVHPKDCLNLMDKIRSVMCEKKEKYDLSLIKPKN